MYLNVVYMFSYTMNRSHIYNDRTISLLWLRWAFIENVRMDNEQFDEQPKNRHTFYSRAEQEKNKRNSGIP